MASQPPMWGRWMGRSGGQEKGEGGLGLGNVSAAGGVEDALDVAVDGKLACGERAHHDATRAGAQEETLHAQLAGNGGEAGEDAAAAAAAGLVDLREEGVRGLGDDGGAHAGADAAAEVDGDDLAVGELLLGGGQAGVHHLAQLLKHDKLGHGVRHLLEQDWAEAGVEAVDEALLLEEARRAAGEAGGVGGVGHQADAGRLQRAQRHVREELGGGGGREVDGGAVLDGLLHAEVVHPLLLEELVAAELEGALQEVARAGGAEAGEQRTSALLLDDLAEAGQHALVVHLRLQLHAGLHHVHGRERAVRDAAAHRAREGKARVEVDARGGRGRLRCRRGHKRLRHHALGRRARHGRLDAEGLAQLENHGGSESSGSEGGWSGRGKGGECGGAKRNCSE
mmetsp:Transcript_17549/g.44923  ORF Transcript_17549/g.44923 Transcript_17549/m.44923 type:complete len:396 (-) Transcript_17549:12-1199(-)